MTKQQTRITTCPVCEECDGDSRIPNDKCTSHVACGLPLEATVQIYLQDVELDEDDAIRAYDVAFSGHTKVDQPLGESINLDDADQIDIYCGNDHPYPEYRGPGEITLPLPAA